MTARAGSNFILPFNGMVPRIAPSAFVAPNAAIIGNVEIGEGASIWFGCTLRADVHSITVGSGTNIQDGSVVHVSEGTHPTIIGSNILIGHLALIHGCILEDGCFIGMKSTIMDGAVVESTAMVAAGALVTPGKRVKAGELWGGSPARKLRDLTDDEIAGFPKATARYSELGGLHAKSYQSPL